MTRQIPPRWMQLRWRRLPWPMAQCDCLHRELSGESVELRRVRRRAARLDGRPIALHGRAGDDRTPSALVHFHDVRQVDVVRTWLEQQPDARRRDLLADMAALDAAARELLFALRVFTAEPMRGVIGKRAAGELDTLAAHVRLTLGFPRRPHASDDQATPPPASSGTS